MTNHTKNQFSLFQQRRFLPLFCTQFLGAFNDNIYKNALIILIAFTSVSQYNIDSNILINLAAGLFILPFFLFSATAGQIADKYEKTFIVRKVKLFEILIMLFGAFALWQENLILLLSVLFFMGTQSVFFGPVKYAVLPQHLQEKELIAGNGHIEMGTFVAILLGTIGGNLLAGSDQAHLYLTITIITTAALGYLTSRFIPLAPPNSPELSIHWNPFSETLNTIRLAKENYTIYLSIIGISWFWFLGATYLTQMPNFVKANLMGDYTAVTLLLCTFTIGIAAGSLLCDRLSGHKIELGLVPLGAIGISLFGIDLYFAAHNFSGVADANYLQLLAKIDMWRILIDILGIGVFGGIYIVPLYALIQQRSNPNMTARIIAVNNIINALFMVLSAIAAILLLGFLNFSIPELFLVVALANIIVCCAIFFRIPEFTSRFIIWVLCHIVYRVKHKALHHIPSTGPAIIVCNPISPVDPLLLTSAISRPIQFITEQSLGTKPILHFIFSATKALFVDLPSTQLATNRDVVHLIEQAEKENTLLCFLLPVEQDKFNQLLASLMAVTSTPVIPVIMPNNRAPNQTQQKPVKMQLRPLWSTIEVIVKPAVEPANL